MVGSGVVGMSIAREVKIRHPGVSVVVVDKEPSEAFHASGRNSGVLHAGFYYSPDSLKAKLTVNGNRALKDFCQEEGVKVDQCGKVVVAQNEAQVPLLQELKRRGDANGVELYLVSVQELNQLEPLAQTHDLALWSPQTAVADPKQVATALHNSCLKLGVRFLFNEEAVEVNAGMLISRSGKVIGYKHLVNASGLYADKLAHKFGFGTKYSMLPFIGLYHYAPSLKGALKAHIYPTPDPRNPFLGVHFTKTVDGLVKVGPTAIPILSREQYAFFSGLKLAEMTQIISLYPKFATSGHHDVWSLIRTEIPKLSRSYLLREAEKLSSRIDVSQFNRPGKPGIRAQLFDRQQGKLEMDYVVEGDATSTHILNAVSPGWTTCLSFAQYVTDDMEARLNY